MTLDLLPQRSKLQRLWRILFGRSMRREHHLHLIVSALSAQVLTEVVL